MLSVLFLSSQCMFTHIPIHIDVDDHEWDDDDDEWGDCDASSVRSVQCCSVLPEESFILSSLMLTFFPSSAYDELNECINPFCCDHAVSLSLSLSSACEQ